MRAGLREVQVWKPRVRWEDRPDGTRVIWQEDALAPYATRLSDRILHWAAEAPDRTWMAERDGQGDWRRVSYAQLADLLPRVGTALLDMGLSVDRPLLILSGNSLEHAIGALGAQWVGIPSAAVAPAYATTGGDYAKLTDIVTQTTPGAILVRETGPFAAALAAVAPAVPVIAASGDLPDRPVIRWADLIATEPKPAAEAARQGTGPDTIAKFMFTSGTTGSPKAVIQTQGMLCANQGQIEDCYRFLNEEPPVFVDWAPWNHTASGSKVFNMTIYHGGTYYIDGGKPSPQGMAETIRNLREIAPTWYFNVPVGFEMLCEAMESDPDLTRNFFSRLKMLMYAGAGLAQHTWDKLNELSVRAVGARTLLGTGLGSTETSPFAAYCTDDVDRPGNVGIPSRGLLMKLVPMGDKLEVRFKGPNVTPGYWRNPKLSAEAFDEEGYYRMGDALRAADPNDPAKGYFFDGRTAENFKLHTGTWVAVGPLRAELVDAMQGLIRDAVIAGENRDELGALLIPFRPGLERLVDGGPEMDDATLYTHPQVKARLTDLLSAHAATSSGSSTRIARAMILSAPLLLDRGEVTDKGSVNQRAVLNRRPEAVEALYAGGPEVMHAIRARKGASA